MPIYFLIGPPAVGKSTTARALAARFEKSLHIPVDDLRCMVIGGVRHPGNEWGQDLVEQLRLARASAADMAQRYHAAGFTVVIDDFYDPQSQLAEYGGVLDAPQTVRILLLPDRETAMARNRQRAGDNEEAAAYIATGVVAVYDGLQAVLPDLIANHWWPIDTTELTVEQTVAMILEGPHA